MVSFMCVWNRHVCTYTVVTPSPSPPPNPPNHQPAAGRSKDETLAAAQKFVTVWPPYLDSGKTLPQGRRIPREAAGAFF